MSVKSTREEIEKQEVQDDISDTEVSQDETDDEVLARLKAKKAKKAAKEVKAEEPNKEIVEEENVPAKIVEEVSRAYNFGVIGSGQAGARLAECFYDLCAMLACIIFVLIERSAQRVNGKVVTVLDPVFAGDDQSIDGTG